MRWACTAVAALVAGCHDEAATPLPIYPARADPPVSRTLFESAGRVTYAGEVVVDASDGAWLAFAARTEDFGTFETTRTVVRRSVDEGVTWTGERETSHVPSAVDRTHDVLVSVTAYDDEGSTDRLRVSVGAPDATSGTVDPLLGPGAWDAGYAYHTVGTGGLEVAGRIAIPMVGYDADLARSGAYLLISDDGGQTVRAGEVVERPGFQSPPTLRRAADGALVLVVDSGEAFRSPDRGETLDAIDPVPSAPSADAPIPYTTATTAPTLLAAGAISGEVGVWRSADDGDTWAEPVIAHHGPADDARATMTSSGLLVIAHARGSESVVTTLGPGWLDAPTCDASCELGARTCDDDGTYVACADTGAVCASWAPPAPSCVVGTEACADGALVDCDEVDGCAGWSVTATCGDAFCFDDQRCGEATRFDLGSSLGPDGMARAAAVDGAGGFAVFAASHDFELDDAGMFVTRATPAGALAWTVVLPSIGFTPPQGGVAIDGDGRVWVAGGFRVFRLALDGASAEEIVLGSRYVSPRSIVAAPGGGVLVAGQIAGADPAASFVRLDAAGAVVSGRTFGTGGAAHAVAAHPDGGAYVAGDAGTGGFVVRYDGTDAEAWSVTTPTVARALFVDGTDVLVACEGGATISVRRYDEAGTLISTTPVDGELVSTVRVDDGVLVVTGQTDEQPFVARLAADGVEVSRQRLPRLGPAGRLDVVARGDRVLVAGVPGVFSLAPE